LVLSWPRRSVEATNHPDSSPGEKAVPWVPLLAVFLLASSGLFVTHGVELRTDTFTTPLTLGVLVLLWRKPGTMRNLILAALLVAMAGLISQKSLYNTVGLALAWTIAAPGRPTRGGALRWRLSHAGVAVSLVAAMVGLWFVALILKSGPEAGVVGANLKMAKSTAFGTDILWADKTGWLAEAVRRSPVLYLGAAAGVPAAVLRRSVDGRVLASACVAAVLLGVIFVHRGFFPYYIASVEPFLALPAAWGLASLPLGLRWLAEKTSRRRGPSELGVGVVLALLVVGFLGPDRVPGLDTPRGKNALNWGAVEGIEQAWSVTNQSQLQMARDIYEVTGGKKLPYLAGIGVAPGYPEVTGYLTGVTRQKRRKRDRNFLATTMRERGVALFVRTYMSRDRYLRPAERKLLYSSYLPVRPNLYLHGARVRWSAGEGTASRQVEILRDASYRLVVRGKSRPDWVRVDQVLLEEGSSIELKRGLHEVKVGPASRKGELWLLLDTGIEPAPRRTHVDYSVFPKDRAKSRSRYQLYDSKKQGYDLLSPPDTARHDQRIARHQRTLKRRVSKLRKGVEAKRVEPQPTP